MFDPSPVFSKEAHEAYYSALSMAFPNVDFSNQGTNEILESENFLSQSESLTEMEKANIGELANEYFSMLVVEASVTDSLVSSIISDDAFLFAAIPVRNALLAEKRGWVNKQAESVVGVLQYSTGNKLNIPDGELMSEFEFSFG